MEGDENSETPTELFIQDCVLVRAIIPNNLDVDFKDNLGTLSITEYCDSIEKFVEWRQCDVIVESEDQEWAVVQDGLNRKRTKSGCYKGLRPPVIQVKVSNIKSFRVSRNQSQLTFLLHGTITHCCFQFQRSTAVHFVNFLKTLIKTQPCRKDPNSYLVMDQPDVQTLNTSFAQLDLFPESNIDVIRSLVQKFHHRPYETTMGAFAKISDILWLNRPYDDEIAERLSTSLEFEDNNLRTGSPETSKPLLLPPRLLPPRCLPLNKDQWKSLFNEDGSIMDSDAIKNIIFRGGVSPIIRKDVWLYLLQYYPWESTYKERQELVKVKKAQYYRMKMQWMTITKDQEDRFSDYKERKSLIEKDVTRTDRVMPFYAEDNNPNLALLHDILMTYVMYNFDLGYVQGMSDLLSPLLYLIQDEVETFWCFTTVINYTIRNYDVDQAGMKEQLQQLYQLLTTLEPELATFLQHQDSSNMFFCFRWLLVWFKREFTFEDIYILWETLWAESRCKNYHLLICVAILETEKETLMSNNFGFTEILKHVNELSNNLNLELILMKAEGLYQQICNASGVPNATKAVLGLPLEFPDSSDANDLCNKDEDEDVVTAMANASISINADKEELAFDQSINMQYF